MKTAAISLVLSVILSASTAESGATRSPESDSKLNIGTEEFYRVTHAKCLTWKKTKPALYRKYCV